MTPRFIHDPEAQRALDLLRAAPACYVTVHIQPDGDAIGSALALYWALARLGKAVRVACADPVPEALAFLPGAKEIRAQRPEPHELLVVPDMSDIGRLGWLYDAPLFTNRPLINMDHHVTNLRYGTVNWVEPRAASTAELAFEMLQALGVPLDRTLAVCLLTGIVTDTLGFRTSSTTPALMEIAGALMEAGAPLRDIIERTFNTRDLSELRLQGHMLEAVHVEEDLIWTDSTMAMRGEAGADENGSSGMANLLLSVRGMRVAVVFIEKAGGKVEVSFRARPGTDISGVALRLGGGGHPQAAGCSLTLPLEEAHAQVLPLVRDAIRRE